MVLLTALVALGLVLVAIILTSYLLRPFKGRPDLREAFMEFSGHSLVMPLIGDVFRVLLPGRSIIGQCMHFFDLFGPSFRFWMCHLPMVVLSRPEDYEVVLGNSKFNNKPKLIYGTVESFFGNGLATINGDTWRLHRKHITHAFHFRILEQYVEVFQRKAHMLVDKLRPLADGATSFNVFPQFAYVTNETIFETAFGLDEVANRAIDSDYRKAFVDSMEFAFFVMQNRVLHPWLQLDWVFNLTADGRRFRKADKMIDEFADRVIQDRRAKLGSRSESAGRFSFLDLMMKLEPSEDGDDRVLNDAEIRGELRTLISVQQTSATIMSFALMMLAVNPDVQQRVLEEAVDELGADFGVTHQSLSGLKHLERVLKETMRMYPVLPVFARDAAESVRVTDGVIPAGSMVALATLKTHRSAEYWDEPLRFDPDRFLPEQCARRHPYTYLPFSAGSRNCIGQKYAMLQMKAVMATLLRRFEVLPGKGCASMAEVERNLDVTTFLTMANGFNIRLRPRNAAAAAAREPAAAAFAERLEQQLQLLQHRPTTR